MICPHCGAAIRDDAKFCTSCGRRLDAPSAGPAVSTPSKPAAGPTASASTGSTSAEKKGGRDLGMLIAALAAFAVGIWNIIDMSNGGSYTVIFEVIPIQYLAIPLGIILLVLYFKD